ncbi:MAG: hypothetical protein CMJ74_11805 [Planctomycetaceae bacterium]|nr:hypothetical protein [Planctomycetaceae bacterium]
MLSREAGVVSRVTLPAEKCCVDIAVAGAAVYRSNSMAPKMAMAQSGWQDAIPNPIVNGIAMHEKMMSFLI